MTPCCAHHACKLPAHLTRAAPGLPRPGLQAALVTCDHIFTVSQAYAWEIALGPQGMGLGGLLKQRMAELTGIVNGIDTREWDPRTDPYLAANYSAGE